MKTILLSILFLTPLFGFAFPATNYVSINNVKKLSFFPIGNSIKLDKGVNFSITSKQNFDSTLVINGDTTFRISADREGGIGTVNWVESQLSVENVKWENSNMASYVNGSMPPEKLNFAFNVSLEFTYNHDDYICNNVILAQGHTGSDNNWWIFANIDSDNFSDQNIIHGEVILNCTNLTDGSSGSQYLYVKAVADDKFEIAGIISDNATPQITANKLSFRGLQLESFSNSQIKVTSNQLYNNVVNVDTSSNSLIVYANRKNSSRVKDWAQDEMEQVSSWNNHNMVSYNHGFVTSLEPAELNFAINGDLAFMYNGDHYVCSNLTFGQGHTDAYNNWWLFSNANFSNDVVDSEYTMISCTNTSATPSVQTNFFMHAIGENLFKLESSQSGCPVGDHACNPKGWPTN